MVTPEPPSHRAVPRSSGGFGAGRSTVYLLGAQVFRNLGPLVILFVLARLTSPETVGTYSLALAIVTPFFVFAQLGMRTVTLTIRPEAPFADYVTVQTGGVALALLASTVFTFIGSPEIGLVVALAALAKVADAYSDFLSGPLQRHGRAAVVFTASVVTAITVSIGAALVLALTRELVPTLLALAVLSLLMAYLFLFRPALRMSRAVEATRPPPSLTFSARIRRILMAGLPLGIGMSAMSLISTVPQYVVTASFGEGETARLAVLLYIYALADIVTGVLCQAWIPHAQEQVQVSERRNPVLAITLRSTSLWTLLYVPVTIAGLVLASWLVPVVFGPAYTLSLAEAVPLGLAVLVLPAAHFMATAVAIRNDYIHTLALALGSTALAVATCLLLVPQLGIAGAFWSLFVAVVARATIAAVILIARGRHEGRNDRT